MIFRNRIISSCQVHKIPSCCIVNLIAKIQYGASAETLEPQAIDIGQYEPKFYLHLANLSQLPTVNALAELTIKREKSGPDSFHEEEIPFTCQLDEPLRLAFVQTERFFAQHMLPVL
uniref:Uncharacterized protein n=1 Tax=Anopheles merus TaxID=30066 RepID=A0A182V1Y7_ANOME